MGIVFILGLVLLSIMFLVFVILSAKTWHWLHIVSCFLAYAMTVTAIVFLALTTKTVNSWKKVSQDNEAKVAQIESEIEQLTVGDEEDLTFSETSLVSLRNSLERETYGRGRVWRECRQTGIGQGWSTVNISTVPSWAADPATYPENRIAPSTILYIFSEREYQDPADPNRFVDPSDPNKRFMVPDKYLGEFQVTAADAHSITVTPIRFGANSTEYSEAESRSWVLYEMMPIDRRDIFDDLMPQIEDLLTDVPEDIQNDADLDRLLQRRARIEEVFVQGGFPFPRGSAEFEAFIDRYAFDNLTMTTINSLIARQPGRVNPNFDPSFEETWVKLRFTTSGERDVDVAEEVLAGDGDSAVTGLESSDFDSQGRARVRSLRQGGRPSEYAEGDELVVDKFTAEDGYSDQQGNNIRPLIPDVAEKVDDVYRRQMTDYEFFFHQTDLHLSLLQGDLARVTRDIEFLQETRDNAASQQEDWETLVSRYSEDNQNFRNDLTMAETRSDELITELGRQRDLFNRLYAVNLDLVRQKRDIQSALTNHINRQTADALRELDDE